MAKHRHFLIREPKFDFLLSGVIGCQIHKRRLVVEWHKIKSSKSDNKISYNQCSVRGGFRGTYTDGEDLENKVARLFKKIQFKQKVIDDIVNQAKAYLESVQETYQITKSSIDNKIQALEVERDEAERLLISKHITREVYHRNHTKIKADIYILEEQLVQAKIDREIDVDLI